MGFPDEEPPSSTATRHSSPVIRLAATTPRTVTLTATRCHPRRSVTTPSLPAHRQRLLKRRGPDIFVHRSAHRSLRPRSPRKRPVAARSLNLDLAGSLATQSRTLVPCPGPAT